MKVTRSFTYPALSGTAAAVQNGVAALFDADAVVTSIATAIAPSVIEDAGLNGAIGGSKCLPWRGLTVTTTASAGSYNVADPIVVVVEFDVDGRVVEETLTATLTDPDGDETIDFDGPFERVKSISIPAQVDALGAFTFGVGDLYSERRPGKLGKDFAFVMGLGTGTLKVGYPGGTVDILPTVAGRLHTVTPNKIFRSGTDAIFQVGS